MKSQTWLALYDIHYPKINRDVLKAALSFLKTNKVTGLIFGGDQLDNEMISHHTVGKALFRETGAYQNQLDGFDKEVLTPIEKLLSRDAKRIYIIGNHERFEQDLIEVQPELKGTVDHVKSLRLVERGWTIIPLGHAYRLGKLQVAHGESVGGMYAAKKAVELYGASVLIGHTHSPQVHTKVSPVDHIQKHQGYVAPIVGNCNPSYLRNKPTAWLNGLVIIEVFGDGLFNVIPLVISKGRFAYGGKVYNGR